MVDTLTRSEVLAAIRENMHPVPTGDVAWYEARTDRIAALALVLPHLPADPVVPAPAAEPAPAQDPECPYPPVMTRWGLAMWTWDDVSWLLYVPGFKGAEFIATIDSDGIINVWGGVDGSGDYLNVKKTPDPMPAILAALRDLGSLPDEVPHG